MSTMTRAIRLAVIVEAVSCIAMLYQDEPLSGWNSWAVHLGWSTRVISDVLVLLFGLIHFPVLFLLYHVRGDVGFDDLQRSADAHQHLAHHRHVGSVRTMEHGVFWVVTP